MVPDAGPAPPWWIGTVRCGGAWPAPTGWYRVGGRTCSNSGGRPTRRVDDVLIEAWVPVAPPGRRGQRRDGQLPWTPKPVCSGGRPRSTETHADLDGLFEWAGATGALIVLSHDPHVDVPALAAGLAGAVSYVGAMGSRSTQSRRLERLRTMGLSEEQLVRIHRPIGLDLGGRRAPEVALAIAAEILAVHCGRSGRSLREVGGPIHGRPPSA